MTAVICLFLIPKLYYILQFENGKLLYTHKDQDDGCSRGVAEGD